MSRQEITEQLIGIYRNYIQDEQVAGNILPETKLEALSISSVDYIKIIIDIENDFNFEFDDEDLAPGKFQTINSMIDYIEEKINHE